MPNLTERDIGLGNFTTGICIVKGIKILTECLINRTTGFFLEKYTMKYSMKHRVKYIYREIYREIYSEIYSKIVFYNTIN